MAVIAYLEQTFGFSVDDRDIRPENFDSIARIVAYAERKMHEGGAMVPTEAGSFVAG